LPRLEDTASRAMLSAALALTSPALAWSPASIHAPPSLYRAAPPSFAPSTSPVRMTADDAFARLRAADPVIRVSDGASVGLTGEWAASERAVLVFFRSFG